MGWKGGGDLGAEWETGFGTLDGFNAYVRRCFIDALMASPSRRIEEELSGPQL